MPKRSPGSGPGDDVNKKFGARLRSFREIAKRSQTDVGQALGVSFQQIQKYENGTTSISLNRLTELADYLTVSINQLVGNLTLPQFTAPPGFSEDGQASYDAASPAPEVGPLSRDAVALVTAYNAIRSRKLRRSILTMVEAYGQSGGTGDAAE